MAFFHHLLGAFLPPALPVPSSIFAPPSLAEAQPGWTMISLVMLGSTPPLSLPLPPYLQVGAVIFPTLKFILTWFDLT